MHPWFKVVKEKEVGEVNSLMVIRNFNEFNVNVLLFLER
jgi:hypothetical protein